MKNGLACGFAALGLALAGCVSIVDTGSVVDTSNSNSVSPSDRREIKSVVYDYFDGQGDASLARLDRAFSEQAAMFGVLKDDQGRDYIRVWPDMNDVIRDWANNANPAGSRSSAILDMDVTDGRIATVHFRYTDRFYDVLTLAKVDGDWEIVSKVFIRQ